MRETKFDWVPSCGERKLIHEAFDCVDVAMSSQCSQRTRSQRHLGEQMVDDFPLRQIIQRNRIPIAIAERLWNVEGRRHALGIRRMPRCEQIDTSRLARTGRVRVAPQLVLPVDDLPILR
jgi:hypothetical protein